MHPLEKVLDYRFEKPELLEQALTHSSYANERLGGALDCNERLEFLGDAVLGMVVADHLYREHPDLPEGDLTRLRASMVCEEALAEVARGWDLGEYIRLGHGEALTGGQERTSILADAVEAVLAALYLDGGIAQARRTIRGAVLSHEAPAGRTRDHKTALQEFVQRESGHVLTYELLSAQGPDHQKTFTMAVSLDGRQIGQGNGHSKKEAEQMAAKTALETLCSQH